MVKNVPNETFRALEGERFYSINLSKLMPSLMGVPKSSVNTARKFVTEHCIVRLKNKEKTVRNMEFWLYVENDNNEEFLRFLEKEENRKG